MLRNLNFLDKFSRNTQIPNLKKIGPLGSELFHADRRRDMVKLIVGFRISAKAPKIIRAICYEYERRLNVYLLPVDDEELGGKGR